MDATVLLAGAAAWTALAILATALAYPLLRSGRRAELLRSNEGVASEPPRVWMPQKRTGARRRTALRPVPEPARAVSLQTSGYMRVVPDRLADQMRTMLGATEARIHVRDPADGDALIVAAASGGDGGAVGSRVPAGGVEAHALRSGQPVVVPAGEELAAAAAAPVMRDSRLAGVVSVQAAPTADPFTLHDLELLCEVAELAGGALERPGGRVPLVESTVDAQVSALVTALELWDGSAGPHSAEVVSLARACGRELGLSAVEQLELELTARLHDVGKIRVPRELLRRPAPLDPRERQLMQLHSLWGAELVAQVPGLAAVALAVRHHHERMDGSGYPAGLAGQAIPLASRVVAVADAYSTMVQGRPYRPAIPPSNAVEELRVHAGVQFDPQVVEALSRSTGVRGVVVPLPVAGYG